MGLLDFLFPKYCVNCRTFGSYLCPTCFTYITFAENGFCTVCQRQAVGGLTHPICKTSLTLDGVFSSLVYKGVVKKMVYQFKYKPYLTDLKNLLTDFFYEGLIQKEIFYALLSTESILVPIPLHKLRLRKRGYNQASLLAEGLSKRLDIKVVDFLERVKQTKTQVGLAQKERAANIKDAFVIRQQFLEQLKNTPQIFLVDDITTSGATLKEASKLLKKVGVKKVWGLTLAHGN